MSKCASCHDFGAGARSFKCLDCHTEIRRRLDAHAGFHARAYESAAGQKDCARCHMEHNGHAFALARLDRHSFDHAAQTGFALEGKHRAQPCEACHNEKRIPESARAEIKVKEPNHTFLGLRRECTGCHEDRHRGQLGVECARCHAQEAWKPTPGFNHARTTFPLTGLHLAVACEKCHVPRAGETSLRFQGLAFNACQSCHADPHRGAFQDAQFRGSCENCHNTDGWKNNHLSSAFHHDATRFPLSGKHADLQCSACHKSSDFRKPIAHERCRDCHQDPHRGQFATRAAGSDCATCHGETGFKPSRFGRDMHALTAFPLQGKHAALACAECHKPAGKDTVYKTGKLACASCHADKHGGEFALAPWSNDCGLCHTVFGFQPSTFSRERHAETHFPLAGRHASVACASCHKSLTTAADLPRRYHFASQTCNACHTDPHQAKLACETCHVTDGWQATRLFDHAATRFHLDGAHVAAKCVQCHPAAATPAPVFGDARTECASCHQTKDPHGGQFTTGARSEDCGRCHTPAQWDPPAFDHDRTRFPLDVAHRNVACIKCHKVRDDAAKPVHLYRGTSTECVQCH